jgi:cytidylate kinase
MKLLNDIIIAIDGYSSCGKSTLARSIAKHIGYRHIDTGAMYRAVTLYCIENNLIYHNEVSIDKLNPLLSSLEINFVYNETNGMNEIYLNNVRIEDFIREPRVSDLASIVSKIPQVRQALVDMQQKMGKKKRIVMDGRDIGTVVFPYADIKFFMNANNLIRAQRRYKELQEKGTSISLEEVFKNIEERDYIDTHREISPLRKADDAIELDNSYLSKEEQFQWILERLKERFSYED